MNDMDKTLRGLLGMLIIIEQNIKSKEKTIIIINNEISRTKGPTSKIVKVKAGKFLIPNLFLVL